jgi:energy-coupling factor transporter transmembrane protein EcfT
MGGGVVVALGFFLIMVILFFLVLFFITLNVVFIIIWRAKKRRGKTPKKRYIVIPIIFLIISILVELIPIGWVIMVRSGNKSISKNVIIAQSGKIGYWGRKANSDDTFEYFEMDGTTYVHVVDTDSSHTWILGKPAANIKFKSSEEVFNKILTLTFGRDDTSTLYTVINDEGFELYSTGGSIIYGP